MRACAAGVVDRATLFAGFDAELDFRAKAGDFDRLLQEVGDAGGVHRHFISLQIACRQREDRRRRVVRAFGADPTGRFVTVEDMQMPVLNGSDGSLRNR